MSDYTTDPDDTGEAHVSSSRISNFAETDDEANDNLGSIDDPIDDSTILSSADHTQRREEPAEEDSLPNGSRAEFTTAFDIIDEMQKALDESKAALFSPQFVKVDKAQFSDLLDELKKVLPVQLERASALMRESERRLEAAQEQSESIVHAAQRNAEGIVAKANEQADFLAGHQNVVALAEEKARDIISSAQSKADHVTQGANEYSATMLSNLDTELEKLSRDVKGGISILRTREQEAASKLERIDGSSDERNR
ncbi:MAG: cell division protein [Bifidobacteriaceae bacterium]|jgi:cell division septum initiation protein DivIVA|nr:cell division protein [Bifidobacteriaceae bacterium]MCI1915323.1 cell division protein [Bifidobacteriaceae bacterium]